MAHMTDETKDRPGVKNAPDTRTYQERGEELMREKGAAENELGRAKWKIQMLEEELAMGKEAFQRMQGDCEHQRLYREFFRALGVAVKDSGLPTFEAVSELLGRFKNAPVQHHATAPAGSCPTGLPLIWEVVRDATAAKDRGDRAEEDRLLALAKRHLDLWIAINKRPGAREELGAYAKVPELDPHKEAREQARAFAEANAKTWREAGAEPSVPCDTVRPVARRGAMAEALAEFADTLQRHSRGSHATVVLVLEEPHFLALAFDCGVENEKKRQEFYAAHGAPSVLVKRRE